MDSKEMKDQAQYIWNRLDDLANTDPKSYKKFIEKQMEEHKLLSSTPEPRMCIQSKILGEEEQDLFVNICSWKRLPTEESESEPIRIMSGFKKGLKLQNGKKQIVIPVSLNDQTLEKLIKNNFEKDELMQLILKLIENQEKMTISRQYKFYKEIYKGDLPADPRTLFLRGAQIPAFADLTKKAEQHNNKDDFLKSTGDLLKGLSAQDDENSSMDGFRKEDVFDSLLGKGRKGMDKSRQQKLIQEVDEEPTNSKEDQAQLIQPEYTLKQVKGDGNSKYQLKIYLPLVSSVQDCSLNITEESIELFVEDKYKLKLQFETKIVEDDARAKFNKRTSHLTVIMPMQNL